MADWRVAEFAVSRSIGDHVLLESIGPRFGGDVPIERDRNETRVSGRLV